MTLANWLLFAGACFVLAITPGPNIIYLLSRTICQGRGAGLVSLTGIVVAFLLHMLLATLGLSAIFLAAPFAYEALKWAGALYLLYLAWQSLRPGARSMLEPRVLSVASGQRLFVMGFLTSLLNPKIAFFYLALFPQFVDPLQGSIFLQSVTLGVTQILISSAINISVIVSAAALASWFTHRPAWLRLQRYVMGAVLGGLGVRLALAARP